MATSSPAKATRSLTLKRVPLTEAPSLATRSALQAKLAAAKPVQTSTVGTSTSSEQQPPANSKPSGTETITTTSASISSSSTLFSEPRSAIEIIAQALQSKSAALARQNQQAAAKQNGEVKSSIDTPSSNGTKRGVVATVAGKRGYASSSDESSDESSNSDDVEKKKEQPVTEPTPPKRRRGRPRKIPNSAPVTPAGKKPVIPPISTSLTPLPKRASKPPARLQPSEDDRQLEMEREGRKLLSRRRGRGCGHCPGCVRDDCGKCAYCKDKPKFGGPGRKKQRCVLRICSNFHSAPGVKAKHILTDFTAPLGSQTKPVTTGASSIVKATLVDIPSAPPVPKLVASSSSSTTTPTPSTNTTPTVTPSISNSKKKTEPKMMKCCQCGREKKQAIARSSQFCTQRCLMQWLEEHPDKNLGDAISEDKSVEVGTGATSGKKIRELKNLRIDMALPGTTLGHTSPSPTSPPITNPLSPPVLAPSPKPLPSTTAITTKKPAQAAGGLSKKTPVSSTESTVAGTKRSSSTPQPPVLKKPKDAAALASMIAANSSKSVTFDLSTTTIPSSSSSSTPPLLSRTIAPTISIVPLDQLSSLLNPKMKAKLAATASSSLSNSSSKIPSFLPQDIRKWSIDQVVKYFQGTEDCAEYADIFQEQEVDGTALLLLSHESLVKCLGLKLGRALKIMVHVDELRKEYEQFDK